MSYPGAVAARGADARVRIVPWQPVLAAAEIEEALDIVRVVANRVRDPASIAFAVESARQQTAFPRSINWRPYSVSQGYAGLALLWAALDASMPNEAWDAVGRDHLRLAVQSAEQLSRLTYGAYSGIAGLALGAWFLSRGRTRYRRLLSSLDSVLVPLVATAATSVARGRHHGVGVSTFDVVSGLTGAGRYLLLRGHDLSHRTCLEAVLQCLVALSEEEDGIPNWHTPPRFLLDELSRQAYPHGNLNCGLAHGMPGPLALLSLAARSGVIVAGQYDAIARIADWLLRHSIQDRWGVNWPTAVPLGPRQHAAAPDIDDPHKSVETMRPSRTAWCYGSPGIARALWLAGTALADDRYANLAVAAMEAVYRRPLNARQIDSPSFCHGVAGLQQITLRFANESGARWFVEAARTLHRQLMDAYEPQSLLGFRNLEPGGRRIDQPGLLDGAAGVALVLLAAASPVEPTWDALFLLS